jgi:hypothetical protein
MKLLLELCEKLSALIFFVEFKIIFAVSWSLDEVFFFRSRKTMKERTLQILRYLVVPCIFGSLTLSADEYGDSSGTSSSQDKGYFVSTYDRVKGKELTPEAGVVVSGGVDVYVQADYILWHASEGGLAYIWNGGSVPILTVATSNNVLSQGNEKSPHFKMSSGFKAGLGLDFHYDGWDMGLNYTWLRPHASSSFSAAPVGSHNISLCVGDTTLVPAGKNTVEILETITPREGFSSWKLHFNVLDLELGRAFFVSPKLVLRPHFGLKGTWDTQRYNIAYVSANANQATIVGTTVTLSSSTAVETYTVYQKQYYWGLGARTGVNSSWMVSRNFSFFGNWALTALWGQFKNTRYDISDVTGTTVVTNYMPVNLRARTHQINPVLEMELGLRYDYWFSDDDYRFRIAASWENQLWLHQNHFVKALDASDVSGNLSLQGFTLNVRFDF